MSLEIKELIEKIKKEAISEAEKKSEEILNQAEQRAKDIIKEAQIKSEDIIKDAENKANNIKEGLKHTLEQLQRDFMITLKNQIQQLFLKIIQQEIREILTIESIKEILEKIILNICTEKECTVYLSEQEFNRLKDTFLREIQERIKNEVNFVIDPQLKIGFRISFNKQKFYFDFSDKALSDYLFKKLQPKIQELLR